MLYKCCEITAPKHKWRRQLVKRHFWIFSQYIVRPINNRCILTFGFTINIPLTNKESQGKERAKYFIGNEGLGDVRACLSDWCLVELVWWTHCWLLSAGGRKNKAWHWHVPFFNRVSHFSPKVIKYTANIKGLQLS